VKHRLSLLSVGLVLLAAASAAAQQPAAGPRVDFGRQIRPLLSDNCFQCHGPDAKAREADLRLDLREGALRTDKPVIVPGKSGESELWKRVASSDPDTMMPPPTSGRKLTGEQKELIRQWIDSGAAWERHWAFTAPVRPALPAVGQADWPRSAIDQFVLARLAAEKLVPSPAAARHTLIRRLSLDLTGLPPTPEEADAFAAENAPDAYERLVDRLLASPRFGERLVWDWLDAARYADTNGYQGDPTRTQWPWRDWATSALNANQPFDEFTVEQLAGDLLPAPTQSQRIATGFHRNHMINGEGGRIAEESRVDYVQDRVETTGTVWMGLTLNCCRCHDHKFDPIAQREYYELSAYFNSLDETGAGFNPVLTLSTAEDDQRLAGLKRAEREANAALKELEQGQDAEAAKSAKTRADQAKKRREDFERGQTKTMVMSERATPRDTFVLVRGAYDKFADKVTHGVPAALSPPPADAPANRLALARWLVAPEHPLTARVTVNRHWQMLLGTGLVKTTEDFGSQGEPPSHPQLLDWLACEFRDGGWDVKRLLRSSVTSSTYRPSSRVTPALAERDPDNRLLARGPRYRLPSWMIRDQALAIGGLLVERSGGPPVRGYQPEGIWEEATFGKIKYVQDHGAALYRRSLYQFWRRIVGPTVFFDAAARQVCQVKVPRTNTPLHALTTLNDVTYVEAALGLAERVLRLQATDRERIETAFRFCTLRNPTVAETDILLRRLESLRLTYSQDTQAATQLVAVGEWKSDPSIAPAELAAFTGLATLLLNLDETICKE
jgi:hypothetical protein